MAPASPPPDAPPGPAIDAWSALVAVYQGVLHDLVGALDRDAGMDSGVFSALAYLERAVPPHRMRMSDLQRLLHPRYSQPGLSRLVQRMEADGLVERLPDARDGRAAVVVSTPAGRARYRRSNAVYVAAVSDRFGRHLDVDQCEQLTALLDAVLTRRADERHSALPGEPPRGCWVARARLRVEARPGPDSPRAAVLRGQGSQRPPDPERVVEVVSGGRALDHGRFPSRTVRPCRISLT